MLFLDPNKPIATCAADTCTNCSSKNNVQCHFSAKDLVHFLSIALPCFLIGGYGVYQVGGWWLALWIATFVGFFGILEIRVLCSHCPHYAEEGKSLKCWANYGSLKIWKYRPGPMSLTEKVVLLSGFAYVFGYPAVFFILNASWFFLLVYIITVFGFFMTLKLFLCTRCMNFACPLNAVSESSRSDFFKNNPGIAREWGIQ